MLKSHSLDTIIQRTMILEARFTVSEKSAARYLEKIEKLARDKTIAFATRNQVRQELKSRGYNIPPRQR